LPDSVKANPLLRKISFAQLLNHTSGLPRLPDNMKTASTELDPYRNYDVNQLYAYLKTVVPKPDGKSNYSNLDMGLAGKLAEVISGKKYDQLLEELIFVPFGMLKAGESFHNNNADTSTGFMDTIPVQYWEMNVMAPAGGLKCNAREMLRYLQFMSVPTDANAARIIDVLLKPTVSINSVIKIGKGWHIYQTAAGKDIYWHNGGTYGFSTFAAFLKDEKAGVIVVANRFNVNAATDALGMMIMKKMAE
jgi:CubicO group peptidase (beta-lactamase class C family)